VRVEYVLVPIFGVVIMVYGVLGGLRAAYWTDLVQGVFIILLSVLLIPAGLNALVEKFGDPQTMSTAAGFQVMHQRLPADYFQIFHTPRGGEFPLHYIIAITLLSLIGIVVQPHFIAIGGGSAKTEMSARVGLVGGVFMKRLCSVGWAVTALVVLALMADSVAMAEDPDRVWGVATRAILAPLGLGLVGLMLACLVAALMSSADCYMLILSALIVRNGYAAYFRPRAGEKECILVGRVAGAVLLAGAVVISLCFLNVFEQLKVVWELPIIFAAPFWVGMFWRRATRWAAWLTVAFSTLAFFVVPAVLPEVAPGLKENPRFALTNDRLTTIVTRPAAPADVARREAEIGLWHQRAEQWLEEQGRQDREAAVREFGPCPPPIELGETIEDKFTTGGKPVYWKEKVEPVDEHGRVLRFNTEGKVTAVVEQGADGPVEQPVPEGHEQYVLEEVERTEQGNTLRIRRRFRPGCRLRGEGSFNLDFLLYEAMGVPLRRMSSPTLETLRLPTRLVLPFVVIILLSLITPKVGRAALDRFYVKMKTPVRPDPAADEAEMEASYKNPSRFDDRRLFGRAGLEFQKPRLIDVLGFVISFLICFAIIWFTVWVANLGS
jgi:SSS family solute:Na+ symporter